jgi:hypothetical protein
MTRSSLRLAVLLAACLAGCGDLKTESIPANGSTKSGPLTSGSSPPRTGSEKKDVGDIIPPD